MLRRPLHAFAIRNRSHRQSAAAAANFQGSLQHGMLQRNWNKTANFFITMEGRAKRIRIHLESCCTAVLLVANFAMLLMKFERRPRICRQLEGTNESMMLGNWIEWAYAKGQKYYSLREFINSH
jgi:hypothetical protein